MSARTGSNIEAWLAPRWSRGGAALARPSLSAASAAAIRIPERLSAQLALVFPTASPQLFIHEGARQSLERKLKASSPGRVVILSITDNRHSIISHSMRHGVLHARIHHMFLDAPSRVVNALVRYVTRHDKAASIIVGNYIEANGARLARRRPRAIPLFAKGSHHDLLAIFNELNERYFGGACHALITWGQKQPRRTEAPRKAIRLGSYSSLERLIRIHPTLDRKWVPRYFVAYVVYHEMLHHMIPAARGSMQPGRGASLALASAKGQAARRVLHPPEFLAREQQFRKYDRALDWERRHITRLLRSS
ncbi:MAG: hypothetical protein JWP87_676 [Labilithrix sp.]|nr:hypothetical protein [Labilithrix sp.]